MTIIMLSFPVVGEQPKFDLQYIEAKMCAVGKQKVAHDLVAVGFYSWYNIKTGLILKQHASKSVQCLH